MRRGCHASVAGESDRKLDVAWSMVPSFAQYQQYPFGLKAARKLDHKLLRWLCQVCHQPLL
jgi:hypothetical protein